MLKALEEGIKGMSSYPATLHDLALWTSITPWSKVSIAEHRTICCFGSLYEFNL